MPDHLPLPPRVVLRSRRAGGGGGPQAPRNPRRHGQALQAGLNAVVLVPAAPIDGVDPDLVFKLSATTRIEDDTLAARQLTLLGESADYTYFVLSSDQASELRRALARYAASPDQEGAKAPLSSLFGNLDAILPYEAIDRTGQGIAELLAERPTSPRVVDISVWASGDLAEAQRRVAAVRAVVEQNNGQTLDTDDRPRYTVVRALVGIECLEQLLALSVVERARTPPVPFLDPADWFDRDSANITVATVGGAPPIGVLDDAPQSAHPLLAPVVVAELSYPKGYGWQQRGVHGSMVAGLAAYGDIESQLRGGGVAFAGAGSVVSGRVLEPDPMNVSRTRFPTNVPIHKVVDEAIRQLHRDHEVRIFNLSAGFDEPYRGPHVSEFTEALDDLARELDVLIVAAAGNTSSTLQGITASGQHVSTGYPAYLLDPEHRIAEPAIGANVLAVGSIARSAAPVSTRGRASRPSARAVAEVDEVSPFSRSGPGVGPTSNKATKPDVVEYGGNYVLNDAGVLEPENPGVSVVSIAMDSSGRLFRAGSGTSFSTPRVARLAVNVLEAYPRSSANLLRALIALSAQVPEPVRRQFPDSGEARRVAGYGRPTSGLAVASSGSCVVMIFEGQMDVDTAVVHPLPIPEAFARGQWQRHIRVALAFDPPVRRERREYVAATVRLDLVRNTDPAELQKIYEAQDPDDSQDLFRNRRRVDLLPGSQAMSASTLQLRGWSPKRLDIDDGDTYYLAVTHRRQTWARTMTDYREQRYALAVELDAEGQSELDLFALVQQRVQPEVRARLR